MAQEERNIEEITFFGGQNTDVALELLPKGEYLYALNIVNNSSGEGNKGVVENLKGNKQIDFVLPEGTNKCIGTANDEEANKFYFFIYNSNKLHCIYQYNALNRKVTSILQNITDTGGEDIMNLHPDHLILHADVVRNNLLYWVDGLNNARKTNIEKLQDKSDSGYGGVVLQSFIDLYKQTAALAPTAKYFSDTDKPFNRLYGKLTKYAQRFVYHDGEKSTFSDFSAVALPDREPFNGVNTIPTNNNGINITVNTGNKEVKKIEIIMQSTTAEANDEGILPWALIATLDKKKLALADNTEYIYPFYNDGNYPGVDQKEVIQPYSFILKRPLCQAITKRSLVQSNGYEGFDPVDIDASVSISYSDLFIDNGTEDRLNSPHLSIASSNADYVDYGEEGVISYDGKPIRFFRTHRFVTHTVVVGNDVKKGNNFTLTLSNGYSGDQFNLNYQATLSDTAVSVANSLKQKLIATGRIFKKTPESPEADIYENIIDSNGNVTFKYIIRASDDKNYIQGSAYVAPVSYSSLKDTGKSTKNIKMGSTIKLGIVYEDFDGRKSLTYTSNALVVGISSVNEAGGIKLSKISLQINHKAPIWAKYYQIVRTEDLRYSDFTQLLVQKVVDVPTTSETNYVDLVIGSFFTYKKIHPNSSLSFEFSKGDRVSLVKKTSDDSYYPFFETEVIAYNPTITDRVTSNITTDGTVNVKVAQTSASNIGKTIVIEDSSREIISVTDGVTYVLSNIIGGTDAKTYLFYDLIDNRGTLRIKKPPVGVVIEDNSIIEVYKPSRSATSSDTFYEFQKKFIINNPGTEQAYHSSNIQNQTDTQPAIIEISEGTVYVRNRELPLSNTFPGTPVQISSIEDPSFSDFYPSLINDNGRVNAEDTGLGEVHFGSRMRFSNNYIEDTSINGLNNFENLNREDFNDNYGDIKLTKFDTNRIYTFKELKTAYIPVDAMITQDGQGTGLLVGTGKLLNPIQYFAWEGGIGNNPESYTSNGTQKYFVSANSGVIIRLGGNGEEPISKTYQLDEKIRGLLTKALNNGAKIFGGFDRKNGVYVVSVEDYKDLIYFDGFNGWITTQEQVTADTYFELVDKPSHGSIAFTTPTQWTYTPQTSYIGKDTWSYRALINDVWTDPISVCIDVVDPHGGIYAWRAKQSAYTCLLNETQERTGYKLFNTLEQLSIVDGILTGLTKQNVSSDADYIPPVYDLLSCGDGPDDNIPNQFTFSEIVDAELGNTYESEAITVSGINVPVEISITAGLYQINSGPWVNGKGIVVNGDVVKLKLVSSQDLATISTSILKISNVTAEFAIITKFGNENFHLLLEPNQVGPNVIISATLKNSSGFLRNLPENINFEWSLEYTPLSDGQTQLRSGQGILNSGATSVSVFNYKESTGYVSGFNVFNITPSNSQGHEIIGGYS